MTQMMEAWLAADVATLRRFYGQGFNANSIPNNPNVEDIPKQRLEAALRAATRNTQKGEYHKIRHGPAILAQLEVARVRAAAAHCDRLFTTLAGKIDEVE
jgi:acyl-coenzyme A thioesterase PaaI-like protein